VHRVCPRLRSRQALNRRLIESIYEWCLLKELALRGLTCVSQELVLVEYKGFTRETEAGKEISVLSVSSCSIRSGRLLHDKP
jgi:hypothetical protein